MRKLFLLAGAAALATAMPALGKNGGQGKGGGNPHAAHGGGGGQGGGGQGRGNGRAERGPKVQQQRAERGGQGRGNSGGGREMREVRVERGGQGNGRGNGQARQAERQAERQVQRAERGADRDVRRIEQREVRDVRGAERWGGWMSRDVREGARSVEDRTRGLRDGRLVPVRAADAGQGCPPGLAKKNAFCMPPGQLRRAQMMGQRLDADRFGAVPQEWQYRFRDDGRYSYRYDEDGFVYRVARDNGLIASIFPLFSNGLSIGEPMPLGYDVYNVPYQYRDDYVDGGDYLYRYDDNAIYRVDQETNLIDSVVALLAGNGLNVGQQLPSGYDAYNLPMDYRDQYVDDQDSMYRYSNGGIYEVDPTTQIVQALVEMIS